MERVRQMVTKKELEKQVKSAEKLMMLLFILTIVAFVMVACLALELENTKTQCDYDCPINDPDKFVYAFPTPITEFINVSSIDPSCILDIRDYTDVSGNVWVDIAPECVEIAKHTFRKE